MDYLREISEDQENFAWYILNNTEGTSSNDSDNPAEQNPASLVAYASGTLYKDPLFKIKTLLGHQRMLEDKRNHEKFEYQLQVITELPKMDQNDSLNEIWVSMVVLE